MPLDLGDIASIGDLWFWFSLTGSCLVWVVTFGQVWMLEKHPHWAALVGIMLHIAVLCVVAYFWNASGSGGGEKGKDKEKTGAGKHAFVQPALVEKHGG